MFKSSQLKYNASHVAIIIFRTHHEVLGFHKKCLRSETLHIQINGVKSNY